MITAPSNGPSARPPTGADGDPAAAAGPFRAGAARPPLLLAVVAVALALAGGWWLGERQGFQRGAGDSRRQVLGAEVARLERRQQAGQASPGEHQRLLELLVALGRRQEAIGLLETLADREPERWQLRLLLAELRRQEGDRAGAERDLRQILSRRPEAEEALQLWSLILLEQGRGQEAEARLRPLVEQAIGRQVGRTQAVPLGLLLAELQQRRGTPAGAAATYLRLAEAFPDDRRPLLALALLRREQGDRPAALAAIRLARQRAQQQGATDTVLDGLAARWAIEPLREPSAPGPGSR